METMIKTKLTDESRHSVAHGLYVAADRFAQDAVVARECGHERMAEQFRRQENETRVLAALFENAETVEVDSVGPEDEEDQEDDDASKN